MKTATQPKTRKSRRKPRTDRFHVSIRRRKREAPCIQLKFGNHLIHEASPDRMEKMMALADLWNAGKHDITDLVTLRKLQLEASLRCS